MDRTLRASAVASLLVLVLGGPLLAQVLPTGDPRALNDRAAKRQMEMRREALRGTTQLLRRWTEAWNEDDAGRLTRLYTEDAVLLPAEGASQLRGRESIGDYLSETLDGAGEIRVVLSDFDAVGQLAYALGTFTYTAPSRAGSRGASRSLEGDVVLVLRRDGGSWRIRSQLFQPRG